jgi:nitrogen fixation protein FixH
MRATFWVAAVIVVAVAAVLLWPRGPQASTAGVATAQHRVTMTVDEPALGANTLDFEVTDRTGRPAVVDALAVELVMPQMGHALPPVTAARTGEGRYRAPDTDIPMSGHWEVVVSLSATEKAVLPLFVD